MLTQTPEDTASTSDDHQPDAIKQVGASNVPDLASPPNIDREELAYLASEDADAGRVLGRILVAAFVYTIAAGGLAAYWTFADHTTPTSVILTVTVPVVVLISISIGLGWGTAMLEESDDSDH